MEGRHYDELAKIMNLQSGEAVAMLWGLNVLALLELRLIGNDEMNGYLLI